MPITRILVGDVWVTMPSFGVFDNTAFRLAGRNLTLFGFTRPALRDETEDAVNPLVER